ncbi:MAG TPA: NADH-quinone oxidoreductase subunit H [Aurantimonas coralicida]|uniref:NADH-quinone oxidoreductase subunit H n=2 Tax=root TaxID=1 RepID=A0A9C9THC9_9HYPH|nr:NADH-quinone oxidoreductase subunit H [Aurantimonas coralicida]HEU01187.1 NADH-quinone oxidoreductase subunit H [Aurantimonas coralicida]
MTQVLATLVLPLVLLGGIALAAVLDRAVPALVAGRSLKASFVNPITAASSWAMAQTGGTEHPDKVNWILAPILYFTLAAIGLSVVPFAPGVVTADLDAGIVLWGTCESLTVVAVFLHGWSANSPLPLIGAYRYVAIGLPAMLLSMFVLIAAALPAQSLAVTDIVEAQRSVWNIVRQPAGFVLFLMLGLSLSLRGPFDYADPYDLAGGTTAEISGTARLTWWLARLAMLVSVSAMAATVFLGGYLGPILPGFVWLVLKTGLVLVVLVGAGELFARLPPDRMMNLIWLALLPLSFLMLVAVGVELLLWG